MNPLTAVFRKLTYRTACSIPDPAQGVVVFHRRWGARTVHDPRVPSLLDARRRRILRQGLDAIDRALLDPATVELLAATAAHMPGVELLATKDGCPRSASAVRVTDAGCRAMRAKAA